MKTLSDNPTAEEAANFFSETPQQKVGRLEIHIKTLKEALSMTRSKVDQLEEALDGLLDGLDANYDGRDGLSDIAWEKRITQAKQVLGVASNDETNK